MSIQLKPFLTPQEYLTLEREAAARSEYYEGKLYALAGASRNHSVIVPNVTYQLVGQLKGRPCRVFSGDMRVKVSASGLYTYPDLTVVCGQPHFDDAHEDTLLNPTVIFEVLSPSTEAYDRGEKFAQYRRLASLTDYLLLAQDIARIEHFTRQPDESWVFAESSGLDAVVMIASIGCHLSLAEVYDKVELSDAASGARVRLVKEAAESAHPAR